MQICTNSEQSQAIVELQPRSPWPRTFYKLVGQAIHCTPVATTDSSNIGKSHAMGHRPSKPSMCRNWAKPKTATTLSKHDKSAPNNDRMHDGLDSNIDGRYRVRSPSTITLVPSTLRLSQDTQERLVMDTLAKYMFEGESYKRIGSLVGLSRVDLGTLSIGRLERMEKTLGECEEDLATAMEVLKEWKAKRRGEEGEGGRGATNNADGDCDSPYRCL